MDTGHHSDAGAVPVVVREARDDDWSRIWPIFSSVVAAGDSYAYPEDLDESAARPWWMEVAPGVTVVALLDDRLVGTAKAGPNRPGRGGHVATASFMVDEDARGRGVGAALCEWALAWATSSGFRAMQFNAVVETNASAISLWRAKGFEIIGTVPAAYDHREHGLVGLHVMHRLLGVS